MKFRRLISILVMLVLVLAFFTNPKKTDFMEFIQTRLSTMKAAPTVEYTNRFLYSQVQVTYFTPVNQEGRPVAVASKEQYIGVFGRFFKQGQ